MRDETVIIRKSPASFAYLFWLTGVRRGEHAVVKPAGTTVGRDAGCEVVLDDETVSLEQARIRREEAVLRADPSYVRYTQKVRWRLIPGIW